MIGERLKALRKIRNKTQDDIAKYLGITRAAYSHFENNRNQPDNEMIVKLANYFDVTADYILGREVPEWATAEDIIELDQMLESNVTMAFGGEKLTDEEKQRVKDILTAIFWEKARKGDS